MVDAAENLCPNVMKKARIREDLIEASTEKISIPRTFVKNVLLEQSGIDILNKIRYFETNLAKLEFGFWVVYMCVCVVEEFWNAFVAHRKLYYSIQSAGNCPTGLGN